MKLLYTVSLKGIEEWANANRISVVEAKFRSAQFGVLQSLADSKILQENLPFKGGNALDFAWAPNRLLALKDYAG